MRSFIIPAVAALFFTGCATFKELTPDPELAAPERGFIELKNQDELFTLEKDGKYFIKFPKAEKDEFCLVLKLSDKDAVRSYLTRNFNDGKGTIVPIPDEGKRTDSLLVYAVDTRANTFFWVIDSVTRDYDLLMHYRYVPRWRYSFETRYQVFRGVFAENLVDHSTYDAIDDDYDFSNFDFSASLSTLNQKTKNLEALDADLTDLGKLFPSEVRASQDTAWVKFKTLRTNLTNELEFQRRYASALAMFQKETETRGSTAAFLEQSEKFSNFMREKGHSAKITNRARKSIQQRLAEALPFYEDLVRNHNSTSPIQLKPPLKSVIDLFAAAGQEVPGGLTSLGRFVDGFNQGAQALGQATALLAEADRTSDNLPNQTSPDVYRSLAEKAEKTRTIVTAIQSLGEAGAQYPCASLLEGELAKAGRKATAFAALYDGASRVAANTAAGDWRTAEDALHTMYTGSDAPEFPILSRKRETLVHQLEDDLALGVQEATRKRAEAFMAANLGTLNNIPALYSDSAFTPAYELTFSSRGQASLGEKRKRIDDMLTRNKTLEFPSNAIKNIYQLFIRDIGNHGVDKARAVVAHGSFYKGNDKQLKGLVDECDVNIPKWIVRPKEYRKVYALPVTTHPGASNEYMFRMRLQIPSEAQFPVFDVNIKLPEDLVRKAKTEQWYDAITINKKPIKNEGRFRITAPLPSNNYECQITPVQMDKAGANVLEVRFRYPGFRVFEISAMAQVPIIKKN
jgi:hypothetical protein